MEKGVLNTVAATLPLPSAPSPTGQLRVLPLADLGRPGRVDAGQVVAEDVASAAAIGAVDDGDRRASGMSMPGLRAAMAGSFQFVIWPRKIVAITGPVRCSRCPLGGSGCRPRLRHPRRRAPA